MTVTRTLFLSLVIVALCVQQGSAKQVGYTDVNRVPSHWVSKGAADGESPVKFTISLTQQNLDKLSDIFWQVSNPESERYRQYPTLKSLHELTAPGEHVTSHVKDWLSTHGIDGEGVDVLVQSSALRVSTTVDKASSALSTSFHTFEHQATKRHITRQVGSFSVPDHLDDHIHLVLGLSEFPSHKDMLSRTQGDNIESDVLLTAKEGNTTLPEDPYLKSLVTPMMIRDLYSISAGAKSDPQNMQSLVAFNSPVSTDALTEFAAQMGYKDTPQVTLLGSAAKDSKSRTSTAFGDLSVQYMTAVAEGSETWAYNYLTSFEDNYWILEWVHDFQTKASNVSIFPHVHVFPQSSTVSRDCHIGDQECAQFGYDMQKYMQATDIEFQKLGAAGHSIIVSSGYNGAVGVSEKCPSRIKKQHITKCEFVAYSMKGEECVWPEIAPVNGSDVICPKLQNHDDCKEAHAAFLTTNSGLPCNVTIGKHQELMSECACTDLQARAVGDCLVGPSLKTPVRYFIPEYPAASPYVTAVGTTRLSKRLSDVCSLGTYPQLECPVGEVVATFEDGAVATSGGGFSFDRMPEKATYQKEAIENYMKLDRHPPREAFNPQNRGYPDVSANGHNCLYMSAGGSLRVDPHATCATAVFGGLVTLLNSKVQKEGRGPLGFLNPTLYSMSKVSPQTFFDVTRGNNSCTETDCCEYGFTAVTGWDPVSGLGTPNYVEFLRFLLPETFSAKAAKPVPQSEGPSYVSKEELPKMLLPFVAAGVIVNVGLAAFLGLRLHKQLSAK